MPARAATSDEGGRPPGAGHRCLLDDRGSYDRQHHHGPAFGRAPGQHVTTAPLRWSSRGRSARNSPYCRTYANASAPSTATSEQLVAWCYQLAHMHDRADGRAGGTQATQICDHHRWHRHAQATAQLGGSVRGFTQPLRSRFVTTPTSKAADPTGRMSLAPRLTSPCASTPRNYAGSLCRRQLRTFTSSAAMHKHADQPLARWTITGRPTTRSPLNNRAQSRRYGRRPHRRMTTFTSS